LAAVGGGTRSEAVSAPVAPVAKDTLVLCDNNNCHGDCGKTHHYELANDRRVARLAGPVEEDTVSEYARKLHRLEDAAVVEAADNRSTSDDQSDSDDEMPELVEDKVDKGKAKVHVVVGPDQGDLVAPVMGDVDEVAVYNADQALAQATAPPHVAQTDKRTDDEVLGDVRDDDAAAAPLRPQPKSNWTVKFDLRAMVHGMGLTRPAASKAGDPKVTAALKKRLADAKAERDAANAPLDRS